MRLMGRLAAFYGCFFIISLSSPAGMPPWGCDSELV